VPLSEAKQHPTSISQVTTLGPDADATPVAARPHRHRAARKAQVKVVYTNIHGGVSRHAGVQGRREVTRSRRRLDAFPTVSPNLRMPGARRDAAEKEKIDVVMATDPDCDCMGPGAQAGKWS
jgi:phosphomannomutase